MGKNRKKKKLKPDVVLKEFFRKPEYFADIFNGVCFQGKQVIVPENLVEMDTDVSVTRRKGDEWKESLVRMRDIAKKVTFQMSFVVLGQELQTYIDYTMPLRVCIYDTSNLQQEVDAIKNYHRIHKTKMSRDEFLSGITKEDRLHPVITLVIYIGEKEWDGPRSLKEMFVEVPKEFEPYLPDYKMNLLEVHHWEKYPFQNKKVRTLFGIIKKCYQKEWKSMEKEYPTIPTEIVEVLESVVQFEGLSDMVEEQEGEIEMCQAMAELKHQYWLEGRSEGEQLGIRKGEKMGILFSAKKMLELGCTYDQIEEKLGITKKDLEEYEEK